jgi:transcriptional regulator with XRE-family HTH domain
METIGARLRMIRLRGKLTLREVEEQSLQIAREHGNQAYQMSASWLDRVERENRGLSAAKLIALSVIYNLTPDQLLAFDELKREIVPRAQPDPGQEAAALAARDMPERRAKILLPDDINVITPPEKTVLLPSEDEPQATPYQRAIVGQNDKAVYPSIRAGSIVLIDPQKTAIASRQEWTHEFDRPLYFLEGHEGYLCGWCEIDGNSEWLTLVPHPLSPVSSARWRYKKEIDVVGQIVAVSMLIAPQTAARQLSQG